MSWLEPLLDKAEVVGSGPCSQVKLIHLDKGVDGLETGNYAVKIIDKPRFRCYNLDPYQEVYTLALVKHPNVVQLKYYLDTKTKLYLVLEPLQSINKYNLDLHTVKKYMHGICLAVQECHRHKIVHRDIKLENVMVDGFNTSKLIDFGFSTTLSKGKIKYVMSLGTIDCLAPEMVQRKDYDTKIDVWALGILLYELLTGNSPFLSTLIGQGKEKRDEQTLDNIRTQEPMYPSYLNDEAVDLIKQMLTKDPVQRPNIDQVLAHPWFTL